MWKQPKSSVTRGRPFGRRIAFAYGGALLVLLFLLPLAILNTMAGHSLMFMAVLGTPVGAAIGAVLAGRGVGRSSLAAGIEFLVAVTAGVAWILIVATIRSPVIMQTNGWMLLPFSVPLIAAASSSAVVALRFKRGT